ncbi:hypothetical protein BHE74_00010486 [Ensete ventricosum]|nr:hypothetical protein BHE74_00010486 [Ensete ventricosum]RZR77308.1 hypothetical protein BHM03_00002347 [Ensete ventricosum]
MVGPWADSVIVPQRRDFRGVLDPLLSWRESVGRKMGQGGGECKGKLQAPRQGRRAEAKELHKTSVDGLLIKIIESEGLQIDAELLDQERKLDCSSTHIRLREPDKSKDKAEGAQLHKSYTAVRMEVDLEECHNAVEADLSIAKQDADARRRIWAWQRHGTAEKFDGSEMANHSS